MAGGIIRQLYIIYRVVGGCCQDLGRGSKFGLSMKSMLRAYITSSQAKVSRSTSLL